MDLSLANIIVISVSETPQGIGNFNTSNLAIFSDEAYDTETFGTDGYKIYLSPTEVGIDWGTDSITSKMANAVFSQQPNILAGNGYLVVIPFVTAVQHYALSGVPASGSFTLAFTQGTTAAINWNDTASAIQVKIAAVAGLEKVTVSGTLAGQAINVAFHGVYGPEGLPTVGGAGLQTSAPASITITPTTTTVGETYAAAITRTASLIQYFGLMATSLIDQADTLAAAAVIQPLVKIGAFSSNDSADVEIGGTLDLLRSGNLTHSRGLYYGNSDTQTFVDSLVEAASYMGRFLSTDFSGSNTTQTMHLKDLIGVQPDSTMTQTLLNKCQAAGVDVYASFSGVAKVFISGANKFSDQVYNLLWFVSALQTAGFNYLAQTSTKVPQTETGMDGLKGAYRNVCEQAITNQYCAAGTWTSPDTFGIQQNFLLNIFQRGYYIYSQPIGQQPAADRDDRIAPLVQIAIKEAGALQKSNVIVLVNA